jgi:hypothetical protein
VNGDVGYMVFIAGRQTTTPDFGEKCRINACVCVCGGQLMHNSVNSV